MSDRDTLAGLIGDWINSAQETAQEILEAGWRPPAQVIDSESELEELPVGVVILTEQGRVARKTEDPSPTLARPYGYWEELGEEFEVQTDELDDLPATVLYMPTEEPAR